MEARQAAAATPEPGPISARRATIESLQGLVPILVALVPFSFGQWGLGLIIMLGGNLILLGRQVAQRRAVGALDVTALALGALLAFTYFGLGNLFLLQHFGVVINGLLLIQIVKGELQGKPWTAQFSGRLFSPEQRASRAFFEGNRFLSRLWGVIFTADILMAAFGTTGLVLFVLPNALAVLTIVLSPRIGHWYGRRFLPRATP